MIPTIALAAVLLSPQDTPTSQPNASAGAPGELQGVWVTEGEAPLEMRVERDRIATWVEGELTFFRIASSDGEALAVWTRRGPETWAMRLDGDELTLDRGDGARSMQRTDEATHIVEPEPLALGTRGEGDAVDTSAIKRELRRRAKRDQEVREPLAGFGGNPASISAELMQTMREVDADNTEWLRGVVTEIGWIDAETFGQRAHDDAFLLVQHSPDLSLMLAALPKIEARVVEEGKGAQDYALLSDRTRMRLGRPQRFGTQMVGDLEGDLYLYPLQDPDKVEELRGEIGLFPLKTYLDLIESHTHKTVRR